MVGKAGSCAWMHGKGHEGRIVNLNGIPKGRGSFSQIEQARAALKHSIDKDIDLGRMPDIRRYSELSGYTRTHIVSRVNARRAEKGIAEGLPRGGPRFGFPGQMREIVSKHIANAKKPGKKVVDVKEIVNEYATASGLVVLPNSLWYTIRSIDPKVKISLAGAIRARKSLLEQGGYTDYRLFRPRKRTD